MSLRRYDAENAVPYKFAAIDTNDTRPYLYLHGKHSNENPAVTGKFLPREALNEINLEINEKTEFSDTPYLELTGTLSEISDGNLDGKSIILTDGWTIICLAR